jgi:cobalt/nickel transport system permease protein
MHLGEGLLPAAHAATWGAVAAASLIASARAAGSLGRVRMGMMTALIFAVTLFPVPIPIVGMTSHMCATPVLALLVGARALAVPTALVLLVQALFFAHGGITTLGANVLTLAIVGPWTALGLCLLLRRMRLSRGWVVGLSTCVADLAVYVADAGILAAALGPAEMTAWFARITLGLAPAQVPLAILEGVLSAALVAALASGRRWPLPVWLSSSGSPAGVVAGRAEVLSVLVLLTIFAVGCEGEFAGVDEAVFGAHAQAAGRSGAPLVDLEGTELGRALFGGAMLAAGVLLGAGWSRWRQAPEPPVETSEAPTAPHRRAVTQRQEGARARRAR